MDDIIFEEIASRQYFTEGKKDSMTVSIGKPNLFGEHGDYYCPCKITINGDTSIYKIAGVDQFQAIQLAFQLIDSKLRSFAKGQNIIIEWDGGRLEDKAFPS